MKKSHEPAASPRLKFFDSLRGFAMLLMATYHFCFDLNNFGVLHQSFNYDSFWLDFRALIMTLFTGLVGVGFSLGNARFASRSFRRRLAQVFACALLITAVTYFMFPDSWVFFGILHFVFVASLLGPFAIRTPRAALAIGIALVVAPILYSADWAGDPLLIVSGLAKFKPVTEDFAPLAPWLGVTLIGVFIGAIAKQKPAVWLDREIPWLSKLGHRSLVFYMTHQLLLFPLAWLIAYFLGKS